MILITSTGELLLYYCHFLFFSYKKKKTLLQDLCCLVSALFAAGIHFQWVKNSESMQFSTGSVGKLRENGTPT